MNPWHTAYIRKSYNSSQEKLCGLLTQNDDQEPFGSRIYRCIVKWNSEVAIKIGRKYDALDLTIHEVPNGYSVTIKDKDTSDKFHKMLSGVEKYNKKTKDISDLIDFSLSGKPLVEKQEELSLSNTIDKFQDIRHIFNLPTVKSKGAYQGQDVNEINFGEYQLFKNLNERRAALSSAVIIDLDIGGHVQVRWEDIKEKLLERHFKEVADSPTRRGQFRRYLDDMTQDKVEIFFPHNVYPFGVLGYQNEELICLASGGLSGRVGNTLEGITRIMYDFFGCDDAIVLDEGYDTFQIVNPQIDDNYQFTNEEILGKILSFTKQLLEVENEKSIELNSAYQFTGDMRQWPLNKDLMQEIDSDYKISGEQNFEDILAVRPHRTQMRSVLIFAQKTGKANDDTHIIANK